MDLDWLDSQFEEMVALVEFWANINSFSENGVGLEKMSEVIDKVFVRLEPDVREVLLFQNGRGLLYKKRPRAPLQVYLGGHIDTVFPPKSPFQKVTYLEDRILQGPGVFDMKGGLVVMFKALEALERDPIAAQIGWTILLNPDEEIGSPFSTPLIQKHGKRCDFALLFEPTLPGGSFVSSRPAALTIVAKGKGKSAHAGREPQKGVNAIYLLAHFISEISKLHAPDKKQIVNVGVMKGGSAPNIIPASAECTLIVRAYTEDHMQQLEAKIEESAERFGIILERKCRRPPKIFDQKTESLFEALKVCGQKLGLKLKWEETGGVTDGNTLAKLGIPTIDTLGVCGGKAHTEEEFIQLNSLLEKAKLTALFLEEQTKEKNK